MGRNERRDGGSQGALSYFDLGRVGVREGEREEVGKGFTDGLIKIRFLPYRHLLTLYSLFFPLCVSPHSLPLPLPLPPLLPLPISSTVTSSSLFPLLFYLPEGHLTQFLSIFNIHESFLSLLLSFIRMNYFKRNKRMFLPNRIFMK